MKITTGWYIVFYHIFLLVAVPTYIYFRTPSITLIAAAIVLYIFCGLSVTAGYHRLYAHKTYSAHPLLEIVILFLGALSITSSALRFSHDHRIHHWHVDSEKDPYNIKKGFWYAHFTWMFEENIPLEEKNVADLVKNKLVMFQHKYYYHFMLISNVVVIGTLGFLIQDIIGAIVFALLLRIFLTHHSMWFVNSIAHFWGVKPYSNESTAVNNFFVALLTFGEGYHNFHHTFAGDYRNGVRWWQFDPTKLLIWSLSKIGLTGNLKRMEKNMIAKRLLLEDKRLLLENVKLQGHVWMEKKIMQMSDNLQQRILMCTKLKQRYQELKSNKAMKLTRKKIKIRLKALHKLMKLEFKAWGNLCNEILQSSPGEVRI
jgi:stearoyl-CoA desaturase (Delta-9 desaturase)